MNAADTSVAVAAALPWHESHEAARSMLAPVRTPLLGPVAIETYSVLTRLPPPQRVPAPVAWEYLREMFALPPLTLRPDGYASLLADAASGRLVGGAVYDAVVATTACEAGAVLLTLDRRAIPTYQLLGVQYQVVA